MHEGAGHEEGSAAWLCDVLKKSAGHAHDPHAYESVALPPESYGGPGRRAMEHVGKPADIADRCGADGTVWSKTLCGGSVLRCARGMQILSKLECETWPGIQAEWCENARRHVDLFVTPSKCSLSNCSHSSSHCASMLPELSSLWSWQECTHVVHLPGRARIKALKASLLHRQSQGKPRTKKRILTAD